MLSFISVGIYWDVIGWLDIEVIMLFMLLGVIIGSIYFILLDELIMGCAQRRIGPLNLG